MYLLALLELEIQWYFMVLIWKISLCISVVKTEDGFISVEEIMTY